MTFLPSTIVEAIWKIADEPIYVIRAFLAYDDGEHLNLSGYHLKKEDVHRYVIPFLKLNPQINTLDISCNYLDKKTISKIRQSSTLKHINAQNNIACASCATISYRC